LNGQIRCLLVYADVNLLGENTNTVTNNTVLLQTSQGY